MNLIGKIEDGIFIPYGSIGKSNTDNSVPVYLFNTKEEYESINAVEEIPESSIVIITEDIVEMNGGAFDSELSLDSENAIQNKVLTAFLNSMNTNIDNMNTNINKKLNIANVTQSTAITQEGYAADARQLNSSIAGTVANKVLENTNNITQVNTKFSNYYSLAGGTRILAGEDLNDMKFFVPGNFYCGQNDVSQTLKNCPTTDAFTLKVELATGDGYPSQTLREFFKGIIHYRFFDGVAIHEWKHFIPQ